MGRLFRNAEFKSIALKMLAAMAVAAALLCMLCALQMSWLHGRAVEQGAAIVGKAIAAHPEFERDIIDAVTMPAGQADIERGRQALAAYGYSENTPLGIDPLLSDVLPATLAAAATFIALVAAALLLVTAQGYSRIYRKVNTISEAAEKVVDGNFGILLPAGEEGEFEVLGHRFNQMANRLKLNVEQLTNEKIFLKNIISDISHQLKTPLSTLVVYNDLMAEDEGMDTEHRRDFLAMGRQQLQRLEWLIQSLLKMARLEAGSIEFRKEPVMLKEVAESAATALQTMAGEAGVSVAVRERNAGAGYTGDAAWLTEAVINIVKNAIEHSGQGSTVEILLDQTPLTASVTVADRGEGIDRADLPHVFDRFYKSARTVKPNSIGIGLAMSKAIVEGQGGNITVKSEKGRGSEFSIVFLKSLGE